MKLTTLAALNIARAARQPAAFAKNLRDGAEFILPDINAPAALNQAGLAALAADNTGTQLIENEPWFIEARNPAPILVVAGGVHIAQALIPVARMTGFEVILIDPRQAFASTARFPGVEIINEWPDQALSAVKPDLHTAIVTLSHDPKLDDPALDHALRSRAFYIGALGSRKSHEERLRRLAAFGHQADALQRIRGPVGLDIAAVTASEIAVSIIAEIIAVRRGGRLASRRLNS